MAGTTDRRRVRASILETKLSHRRRSARELARTLGNVTWLCRHGGRGGSSVSEWKRRLEPPPGLKRLRPLLPIARSRPRTAAPEVGERRCGRALAHPGGGCNRRAVRRAAEGKPGASNGGQRVLDDTGRGTRSDRWLAV